MNESSFMLHNDIQFLKTVKNNALFFTTTATAQMVKMFLIIMMILLHDVSAGSSDNKSQEKFRIKTITRSKYGQDEFFLVNVTTTVNKDGGGSCGSSCSAIFGADTMSHDGCHCRCQRGKQTFLLGARKCETNDKRKINVCFRLKIHSIFWGGREVPTEQIAT